MQMACLEHITPVHSGYAEIREDAQGLLTTSAANGSKIDAPQQPEASEKADAFDLETRDMVSMQVCCRLTLEQCGAVGLCEACTRCNTIRKVSGWGLTSCVIKGLDSLGCSFRTSHT